MTRRVVVTGLGTVNAIGNDLKEYWDNLVAGKSGAARITEFDVSNYHSQIACQVKDTFDVGKYVEPKEARRMDPFSRYGMASAAMAYEDSGLDSDREDPTRVGVIIGSGIGGIHIMEEQYQVLLAKGPRRVSPFLIPMLISNMLPGLVSIKYNCKGYNTCVTTACASATHALGDAYHVIKRDDADVMFVGGSEAAITPLGFAGFCIMRAVSSRNDEPEKASRPFDAERDGFVIGDGAAVLIIEELEHAKKRGARIYCEITGYGATADAFHITAPPEDGEGGARAMKLAIKSARLNGDEVDYLNAHGTSTPLNDVSETKAIKAVFGDHAHKMAISSTKSMHGHLLGAAGAVEGAATILAIYNSVVPPTINYEYPDPECDLNYTPNEAKEMEILNAISNGFGFGGQNACVAFRRFE